jgi:hypothetical protein
MISLMNPYTQHQKRYYINSDCVITDEHDITTLLIQKIHNPAYRNMELNIQHQCFDKYFNYDASSIGHDTIVEVSGKSACEVGQAYIGVLEGFGFKAVGTSLQPSSIYDVTNQGKVTHTLELIRQNVSVCKVDPSIMQCKRRLCDEVAWRMHVVCYLPSKLKLL